MISDILADAVVDMQHYLNTYAHIYTGTLRTEIERVTAEMEALRATLDRFPPQDEQQRNLG